MNAILTLAQMGPTPALPLDRLRRITQVLQNPVKDTLALQRRGKQSLDVLHDEHGRTKLGEYLKILDVEPLAFILCRIIFRIAPVARSTCEGIRLAGRAADQHPARVATKRTGDPFPNGAAIYPTWPQHGAPRPRP